MREPKNAKGTRDAREILKKLREERVSTDTPKELTSREKKNERKVKVAEQREYHRDREKDARYVSCSTF